MTAHSPSPAPRAWSDAELADPHASPQKHDKVRGMFASIAGSYDLNNRVHSLGRDQAWRRAAVKAAAVDPGDRVLDVACGTGDLTQLFARTAAAEVIGLDFTPAMLDHARVKQQRLDPRASAKITYLEGDAQNLPFPDGSFNVLSIAFGIRNVVDPARAIREFARVLRPGGRLVVLEFDTPRNPLIRWCNDFYSGWIMPRTATLISGDRSGAYRYLPKSVGAFMSREELKTLMTAAGLEHPIDRSLTFGVCVCYRAVKPAR
jgi:demethylmenaquinone methyltransferase / 2-methoxy-6-polyprenyl-1,4-benzoquinol methylase